MQLRIAIKPSVRLTDIEYNNKAREAKRKKNNSKYKASICKRHKMNKAVYSCFPRDKKKYSGLWKEIASAIKSARSNHPIFIVKKSKIKRAGRGVFVSEEHNAVAKDTVIPYPGIIENKPSNNARKSRFQVVLKNGKVLRSSSILNEKQPLGNFVNRVISKELWKKYQAKYKAAKLTGQQNLSVSNAKLIVLEDICYLRLTKKVKAGQEILTTYGSGFKIA